MRTKGFFLKQIFYFIYVHFKIDGGRVGKTPEFCKPFGYILGVLKSMYVDVGSTPALSSYLFMSSIDLFSNKIQQKIS